jgi:hypothetical protein
MKPGAGVNLPDVAMSSRDAGFRPANRKHLILQVFLSWCGREELNLHDLAVTAF